MKPKIGESYKTVQNNEQITHVCFTHNAIMYDSNRRTKCLILVA